MELRPQKLLTQKREVKVYISQLPVRHDTVVPIMTVSCVTIFLLPLIPSLHSCNSLNISFRVLIYA